MEIFMEVVVFLFNSIIDIFLHISNACKVYFEIIVHVYIVLSRHQ